MRNYLSFIAFFITTFVSSQEPKGMVIIKGTLNGDLKGYNTIYMYTRLSNDSAEIKNGNYTFSFPFEEPGLKMLYPQYTREMHQIYQPFGILIAGPGTYYISSDISQGMHASKVSGAEPMMLYKQFENDHAIAKKTINTKLVSLFGDKWWQVGEKDEGFAVIQQAQDSLSKIFIYPLLETLLKEHPDSYASVFILSNFGKTLGSLQEKERWLNMLSGKMKISPSGIRYADYVQGLKSSGVGNRVSNFVLYDENGSSIDFDRLAGKYVLIDFWASWCVPCRRSFPYMRSLYQKYKSDKFEIYSISIDEDKNAWHKALQEENNPWLQSLDTKNISQKGFAVTGVPASFLIDPSGIIIAKEVGFDENGGSEIEKKTKNTF